MRHGTSYAAESPIGFKRLSQLRFKLDSRTLSHLRFDSSIRERNEHVQFFAFSNLARIELKLNRLSQLRFELYSNSIRFENSVTIAIRFEHSRKDWTCSIFDILESSSNWAQIELESNRLVARFDWRTLSQLRFDSSIREFSILESNRARIELES